MKTVLSIVVLFIVTTGVAVACYNPEPTEPVPSIEPSIEPSVEVTVAVTEPVVSATVAPTATPSAEVKNVDVSDGRSDGRSDGLCSLPPCVTPGAVVPLSPPAAGRG